MSKINIAFFGITLLCCVNLNAQIDSISNTSLTARYAYELFAATGKPIYVKGFEAKLERGKHTIIPTIMQKSIYDLSGYQFGMAYYKKWKWGYTHMDLFLSPESIYPKLTVRTNLYCTIKYGLETNLGYNRISYSDGNTISEITTGATFYFRSYLSSYNLKVPFTGTLFHRFLIRKYLNDDKDHLQISLSNGIEQDVLNINGNQPIDIFSLQVSIFKTIIRKTQIQITLGLVKAENELMNNPFVNYSIGLKREI